MPQISAFQFTREGSFRFRSLTVACSAVPSTHTPHLQFLECLLTGGPNYSYRLTADGDGVIVEGRCPAISVIRNLPTTSALLLRGPRVKLDQKTEKRLRQFTYGVYRLKVSTSTRKAFSTDMTKLGQVASIRMGYPFRSRLEPDATGAIAVVQMKDIDDASLLHVEDVVRVDLPDFNEHHLIRRGDLVFRSRGRTHSVALVSADVGPAVLAAPMLLIRPIEVLPAYLLWYINLPAVQATLAAQAEGTSVRMISKAALKQLVIAVPPLETQRRIVEIGQLASQEARITTELMDRRKALIDGILMRKAQDAH